MVEEREQFNRLGEEIETDFLGPGIYIRRRRHFSLSAVELFRASFPASIPLDLGGVDQSNLQIGRESPSRPEQEVDELRKSTQAGLSPLTDCGGVIPVTPVTMCQVPLSIFPLVFTRVTA